MTDREFICEVCDRTEVLTNDEAYANGWDYPPFIGTAGAVSPRTCPNCSIDKTAWWAIIDKPGAPLSDRHRATVLRIMEESDNA